MEIDITKPLAGGRFLTIDKKNNYGFLQSMKGCPLFAFIAMLLSTRRKFAQRQHRIGILESHQAPDIWNQCIRKIQKSSIIKSNYMELTEEIGSDYGKEVVEEVAMVSKRVWQRRNTYVFQPNFIHPNTVVQQAQEVLKGMKDSKTSKVVQPGLLKPTELRCHPPPLSTYKIN